MGRSTLTFVALTGCVHATLESSTLLLRRGRQRARHGHCCSWTQGGGRLRIAAAALTPLRPLMNLCCITAAVRHCCHCLVRVCSRRRCLRWVLLAGCRWQICSRRCHLLWGNHSAGGSDERGWRPRWHTTLTLVAHTCWVSRPLHGAASLLPGCCCCCCCCRRAVTGTGTLSAAVASRASLRAAPASVGGGRVRLSARTPAAPACCVLASVSRCVPAANTAVFVSLLLRACACGSSTKLVLFYGQPADSAMRVSVIAAGPHGAARKGGRWTGGAGCCRPSCRRAPGAGRSVSALRRNKILLPQPALQLYVTKLARAMGGWRFLEQPEGWQPP